MRKYKIILISLLLLSFFVVCVSFAFLGDTIPTHFGPNGKPDQYGSKYFLLLFPTVGLIICTAMLLVSKYGKVSENYSKYMFLTGIVVEALFLVISTIMVIFALGVVENAEEFDISKIMMPILGMMFIFMANFMPKIEKNRTLGFKIKWSMYNEVTWQKTHRFTGFVGVIVGIIMIAAGIFFKEVVNVIILICLLTIFITTVTIASYKYYKEEKSKE